MEKKRILDCIQNYFHQDICGIIISYGYYLDFEPGELFLDYHFDGIISIIEISNQRLIVNDLRGLTIWDIKSKQLICENINEELRYPGLISEDKLLFNHHNSLTIYDPNTRIIRNFNFECLINFAILKDGGIVIIANNEIILFSDLTFNKSQKLNIKINNNEQLTFIKEISDNNLMIVTESGEPVKEIIHIYNIKSNKILSTINICKTLNLEYGKYIDVIMINNQIVLICQGSFIDNYNDYNIFSNFIVIIDGNGKISNTKLISTYTVYDVYDNQVYIVSLELNKLTIKNFITLDIYDLKTLNLEQSISAKGNNIKLLPDSRYLCNFDKKIGIYDPFINNIKILNHFNTNTKFILLKDSTLLFYDRKNDQIYKII